MGTPEPGLAAWAVDERASSGRRVGEPSPTWRTEYQRDRDRVIHSSSFRRLMYKTQVFVNHEGDLYRTRLTHSLEVAQIARTVAGALSLNGYLTEAICFAHDLGHTPFGHAGQDALNACMADFGGFEHNMQSLRVVDELEEKYAEFSGLNLMFETREGLLKYCAPENAESLGELGRRFLEDRQPSLEAQVANLADEIAYNNHDVDDGLRAGLLTVEQLREVDFFDAQYRAVRERYPDLNDRRLTYEIVRRMIGLGVEDLVTATRANIEAAAPGSVEDVRARTEPLARFSTVFAAGQLQLKRFLHDNLYRHPRVLRMTTKARRTVTRLFDVFLEEPRLMPEKYARRARAKEDERGLPGRARVVADYIAGMTDRYAIIELDRLFDPHQRT